MFCRLADIIPSRMAFYRLNFKCLDTFSVTKNIGPTEKLHKCLSGWNQSTLKVTSAIKLFFCCKIALDEYLINFFIWREKNVLFSRYPDCCVFCEIHRFHNPWRHHRHCYIMEVTLVLIFLILSTIKMKFGHNFRNIMKN